MFFKVLRFFEHFFEKTFKVLVSIVKTGYNDHKRVAVALINLLVEIFGISKAKILFQKSKVFACTPEILQTF